ncbi:MAG: hypothetical protein E7158_01675 [Firmicutes bacterium]|nr:hypothetical protein [Bacillota bacterium]
MLEFNDAKKILKYYGFINNNVEPILCEKDNLVGIFATYKTKYGHLSRVLTFKTKKSFENYLKMYLWYRKEIDNDNVYVEFDNYENLTPEISFFNGRQEVTVDTLNNNNKNEELIKEEKVEELVVDTTHEDNLALLNVIYSKIKFFIQEAKALETDVINIISNYLDDLSEFLDQIDSEEDVMPVEMVAFDAQLYENQICTLLTNFKNDSDDNFNRYFDEAVKIYGNILLDSNYVHNMYLKDFYENEILKLEEKKELCRKYEKEKNSKTLKKLKINSLFDYIDKYAKNNKFISKNTIIKKRNSVVSNIINELTDKSIEELKYHYNIVDYVINREVDMEQGETLDLEDFNKYDLHEYYNNLTSREKSINLILSSPIKELINDLRGIKKGSKIETVIKEKHFYKKFNDVYELLSSDDNYAICKKYLKNINLDSLEEFIESVVKVKNSIHKNTLMMPTSTIFKYKIGVFLNDGFINASVDQNFPNNNRGSNNYVVSESKTHIPVYFSDKIVKIDEVDNTVKVVKNDDIVTFNINGYEIVDKKELKVNNYELKKNKKSNSIDFKIFSEKKYITSSLDKNGDNE